MVESLLFSPSETLSICVGLGSSAQTALRMANPSTRDCAFKVKTTTPERYLVKPNHGVIRSGCTADITIVIVQAKKKDLLTAFKANGPVKCTDKFLVQNVSLDRCTTDTLECKSSHEFADAISRLFSDKTNNDLGSKKLLVELSFPDFKLPIDQLPLTDNSKDKEHFRLPLLKTEVPNPLPETPEAMFSEIVALRKKYDDLVAFTVNLTTERDCLASELIIARRRPITEGTRSRDLPQVSVAASMDVKSVKANSAHMQMIFIGLAAFFLGRFFPTDSH